METVSQLLTTFGVAWPKFLAQVILFLTVYLILKKFAFGPIIAVFEQRRRTLEEAQANAEKIKRQLAESELRCQEILKKANADAQRIIEEGRASADAQTQKSLQQAIKDAEGIIEKANENVELERARMVAEVKGEMVRLVVDTTAKVAGKILTKEDQDRLASETTKQLAA
ncbi:MAG: F0F1 ATP synthase subunit B [Verrucomicrobia bacterium]|jgi:F-type H+-transporting ATPase subunit b|nr:F0F1 ATP synthase subunit B [Verrucomicrobiota bacterium]